MYFKCDRCGTVHGSNPSQCRSCGHNILSPASEQEVKEAGGGVSEPETADVQATGSRKEPEYESSPDVAIDGSVEIETEPSTDQSSGGIAFGALLRSLWARLQLLPVLAGLAIFLGAAYLWTYRHPDIPQLIEPPAWVLNSPIYGEQFYLAIVGGVGLALMLWQVRPR